ncbi:response regulator, partial [Nocardiopsis halotolerans]|uniref:response regulator n=1 Tax=Nocardiopsis halotolerans TaxID=124252 RepID=UPI0003734FF2
MSVRIIIADDQHLVRLGLRLALDSVGDFDVVADVADGSEAVDAAVRLAPDVVLMDARMPVMDGIEATRRLVAAAPRVRVLVLTTFDLDEVAFAAVRAGAGGFLLKDVRPEELESAIRSVADG